MHKTCSLQQYKQLDFILRQDANQQQQQQHVQQQAQQLAQQQQQNQQQQQQQQQQQNQQQHQQQQQQMTTREVMIGNQAVHVQVLQGTNTAQVIKYEINIPQENQNIE